MSLSAKYGKIGRIASSISVTNDVLYIVSLYFTDTYQMTT